jgi:sarcosine oxidase subunit alpha
MTLRTRPIHKVREVLHDGEIIEAEAGEPLAFSLIASERLLLSRSPKLHRPRGPYCLRAACDGCLLRVDGVPNVMACRRRVLGGETVETQNVVGSREVDLLAATDFMFPHGIDHHRLFAGVRGVSEIVQRAARRIAGLGRLPDAPAEVLPSEEREVEVLVVGGGASGLAVAAALGPRALLVEESARFGGARALVAPDVALRLTQRAQASGAELSKETCAVGVFQTKPFGVLLSRARGLLWVRAERLVLANGGHDASPEFANGDLPGVFSARAGLELVRAGILPGRRVALVGRASYGDALRSELGSALALEVESADRVEGVVGAQRVSRVRFEGGESSKKLDAVLFDALEAPAFELAVQAGARVRFEPALGYVLERSEQGELGQNLYGVGRLSSRSDGSRAVIDELFARLSAR